MGLDMYLNRRTYVKRWDHIPADRQFCVSVKRGGKRYDGIDPKRVSYVVEEVAYWRKANAIHRWFVQNVQKGEDDCRSYPVDVEQLQQLVTLCKAVLRGDVKGEDQLPTQSGFFFGNTEYDADYRCDLEDTVKQLEPLLAMDHSDSYLEYEASW